MQLRRSAGAALLMGVALLCAPKAQAQSCSFSVPNINFGTIDVTANINFNTSVNLSISCTGNANQRVRICPNINAGTSGVNGNGQIRYMLAGVNQMNFNIYRDNYANVWGSRIWGLPPTPPTITIKLNGAGSASTSFRMRARVFSGQTGLPSGIYSTAFSSTQTRFNYAYTSSGDCAAITAANRNPTQVPFSVSAQVAGACAITATDIDFGTQAFLDSNTDQTGIISVRCPINVPYTIGLDGGLANAASPAARQMSNGSDTITYGIYTDSARTAGWGDSIGVNTIAATGTGSFQDFTAYGRIPQQSTPPADLYQDDIVVTVTY